MALLLIPTTSVFAQEADSTNTLDPVARCEAFAERSQERYDANETRHAEHAQRMSTSIEKLKEFVEKASSLGADTSSLESDIASLESYQSELNADHEAVQAHLTEMTQLDCETKTHEEIKNEMAEARSLFDAIKSDVEDIRELRKTIKTHVSEIIAQILPSGDSQS